MAQVINTNSLSLITQNNINKNQSALSSSIERLSSGLRINSAKDDAAGQAIANRFTSNIKGLTQAARNANDGISLAQTTEGALSEINNNLQRVRELTVQATTGTNSDSDLSSIQDEIKSRLSEIDRVSGQTQFNGVNVLAKNGSMAIQVGANDGQTINIDLQKIDSSTLGLGGFSVSQNSLKLSDSITTIGDTTAASKNVDLSAVATKLGVNASTLSLHEVQNSAGNGTGTFVVSSGSDNYSVSVDATSGAVNLNTTDVTYDDATNGVTGATQNGQLIKVTSDSAGAAVGYVTIQGKNYQAGTNGTDVLANSGVAAPTTGVATGTLQLSGAAATAELKGTATQNPLALLDKAIASVDKFRSSLGAVQNRLSSAVTNLNNTTTNLSEAQSRIQDADYATEHSLWQRYVPLVRHEALRLQVRLPASVELDDLLQAGGIGLLNAVDRYDALQGTAFTTYAVQRIRGAMLDELRSRDWVPRSVRRNAREVAHAMGQLEQELGRNATETEVAERLGIAVEEYRQMLLDTNNSQLFSYDEWREEHGDSIELVTDEHQQENPLHHLMEGNLRQRVMEAIEALPEREQLVLTLYYQEELNLKEIGAVLEVGESRVSQLHSQAIKRLRTKLGKL